MKQLIDFIKRYTELEEESIALLRELIVFEEYQKDQYILTAGQICNKVWFVKSGMIKKFHLLDGKEITSWIHFENEMVTSLNSYTNSVPTTEYFQACEKSILISITKQNSEKLSRFPQFITFSNSLLSEQLALIDIVAFKFKTMDATEKYNYLLSSCPELFKRAKLGYIASIMGVTQETLSRIRKHISVFDLDQKQNQ